MTADSVQHLPYDHMAITAALRNALSPEYQAFAQRCPNPYDPFRDGKNSLRIVQALQRALASCTPEKLRVKKFITKVHSADWNTLLTE